MTGNTTQIGIKITADPSGVEAGVGRAKRSLDDFGSSGAKNMGVVGEAVNLLQSKLAAIGSGLSLGLAVGQIVAVQREFDVLNASLQTVAGGSAAAEREMAWLKVFAKETPFGLAQATGAFVKMKALGLDPTRAALTSFGNTASAMGKDLTQMIEAVADATTGEFERLKEFGIKASQEGDRVSLTFQGVTTNIGNNAAEINRYLEDIGNNQFAGAMEARAQTLDGAIASLGDTWNELFLTISNQGVGDAIAQSVRTAEGAVSDLTTIIRAMGGAAKDSGDGLGILSGIQTGLATSFEAVAVLGTNVKFTLTAVGKELGGLAAQAVSVATGQFAQAAQISREMRAQAEADRRAVDATSARILSARQVAALSAPNNYDEPAIRRALAATTELTKATTVATVAKTNQAKATKEVDTALQAAQASAKAWASTLERFQGLSAAAEADALGLGKAQTALVEYLKSAQYLEDVAANREQITLAAAYQAIAEEDAAAATKAAAAAAREANAAYTSSLDAYQKSAASAVERVQQLRQEAEAQALATAQNISLAEAVELVTLARLAEKQAGLLGDEAAFLAVQKEIDARRELLGLIRARDSADAAQKSAQDAATAWQKASDDINKSLTDALLRGFESGKDFGRNLVDSLKNMLSTLVARPFIGALVNPIAGAITGGLGLSNVATAATATGGSGSGGGLGLLGSLPSAASLFSAAGTGLGAGFATLGSAGIGGLLSASTSLIGTGTATGALAGAGLLAGPLGAAGLIANALGLFRKTKTVGTGLTGTLGEGDLTGYALDRKSGSLFSGPDYRLRNTGVSEQSAALQASFRALREETARLADVTGLGGDSIRNFTRALGDELINPDTGGRGLKLDGLSADQAAKKIEQALAGANEEMARTVIQGANLTGWMRRIADSQPTATAALQKLASYPDELLKLAGTSRDALVKAYTDGLLTGDATTAGQTVADGLVASIEQALVGNAASQVFDIVNRGIVTPMLDAMLAGQLATEAVSQAAIDATIERAVKAAEAIGRILNDDAFRAAMDNLRTQVAGALGTAGAAVNFTPRYQTAPTRAAASLAPDSVAGAAAATDLSSAVKDLAQAFADAKASLLDTQTSLQADLARAQGDEATARSIERTQALAAYADLGAAEQAHLAALYDQNQALRDQVTAIDQAKQVAQERTGLERALLQAQGNTTALRAQELAALDPSNRALQERIYAIEDESAALEKLRSAQTYSLSLRGDSERQMIERAANATDRALQAAQAAAQREAEAARKAIETSRKAAQSLAEDVRSVFETARSAVERLRLSVDSTRDALGNQALVDVRAMASAALSTGALPSAQELDTALSRALAGIDGREYATPFEQDRDRLVLAGYLADIEDTSGKQLTETERQLQLLDAQLEAQNDALAAFREQIDVMRGVEQATGPLAGLLQNLADAIGSEQNVRSRTQNGSSGLLLGTGRAVYDTRTAQGLNASGDLFSGGAALLAEAQKALLALPGVEGAQRVYDTIQASGYSLAQMNRILGVSEGTLEEQAKLLGLPVFHSGTPFVPRTGFALLEQGEAVIPRAYNPMANGLMMTDGNPRTEALLQALNDEIKALKSELQAIKGNTAQFADQFDRVSAGGNALATEAA